ncbi:MAG: hypothetical protein GY862_10320 [Gammaproteobacteria bacterium]|nr:hypothetical protein [Gammaproteobacteria bacterium]
MTYKRRKWLWTETARTELRKAICQEDDFNAARFNFYLAGQVGTCRP